MAVIDGNASGLGTRTADSLIRDLKSAHLSSSAKLELATAAWRDPNVLLPRKDKVLLDLLMRELLRSASAPNPTPTHDISSDPAHLNPQYWEILTELLSSASDECKLLFVPPSLLQVFGAPFRNGECPDEALVEALARCFTELYAPDDTKSVALPKFELYMQLLVAMCETFVASSMPPSGEKSLSAYLTVLWGTQLWLQSRQPNQRKVFQAVVQKLLQPALRVRHKSSDTGLVNVIDATLASALFHGDHLADYAAAFTKSDKKDNRAAVASYPRHFFDLLRTSLQDQSAADTVLSALAHPFLDGFLDAVNGQPKETDNQRSLQLSFFHELYGMLGIDVRDPNQAALKRKLGVVKEMLVVLSQRGVYNPADDTLTTAVSAKASAVAAAKRNVSAAVLTWLQEFVGELLQLPIGGKTVYPADLVAELFGCISATLRFTYLAVNDRLKELWRKIWAVEALYGECGKSPSMAIADELFGAYTKLRQLDRLISAMLPDAGDTVTPHITHPLLEAFERAVQEVPSGQLAYIVSQLTTYLKDNFFLSIASGTDVLSVAQLTQLTFAVEVTKAFIRNMVMNESSARSLDKPLAVAREIVTELVLGNTQVSAFKTDDAALFCGLSLYVTLADAKFLQQLLTSNKAEAVHVASASLVLGMAKSVFEDGEPATPRIQYLLAASLLQQLRIEEHLGIAAASEGVHMGGDGDGDGEAGGLRMGKCKELTRLFMTAAEAALRPGVRIAADTEWVGDIGGIADGNTLALALWQLVCQHLSTLYVYFSEEHTAAVARAIVDIVAAVGDTYNRPEATSVSNRTGTWATVTATLLTDAAFVELVGIVTAVVACVAVSLASTVERIMGQTQAAGGAKRKKSGKGQVGDGGSVGRAGGLVADEKAPEDFGQAVAQVYNEAKAASFTQGREEGCRYASGLMQVVHALPVSSLDFRTAERCMRFALVTDAVASGLVGHAADEALHMAEVSRGVLGAVSSGLAYNDRASRVLTAATLQLVVESTIDSPVTGAQYSDIAQGIVAQYIARAQHQPQTHAERLDPLSHFFASLASDAPIGLLHAPGGPMSKPPAKRKAGQANADASLSMRDSRRLSLIVTYYSAMCDIGAERRAAPVRAALVGVVQRAMAAASTSTEPYADVLFAHDAAAIAALGAVLKGSAPEGYDAGVLELSLRALHQATEFLGRHLCSAGAVPETWSLRTVLAVLEYIRTFCSYFTRIPVHMRADVFQRVLALLLSAGAGCVRAGQSEVLAAVSVAMCSLVRECDGADVTAIVDVLHKDILHVSHHPWQAFANLDGRGALHRAHSAAVMLHAIYGCACRDAVWTTNNRDKHPGTDTTKAMRGALKRAVQPILCAAQAAMLAVRAAAAQDGAAEDGGLFLGVALRLLEMVDAMVNMHDFSFGVSELSVAVTTALLAPLAPERLRSSDLCADVFDARYRVLQQLARRYPEPLSQCIPVAVDATRALVLELVRGLDSHCQARGRRNAENAARLLQELAVHKDAVSKHAPYLVADYIGAVQSHPLAAATKAALLPGIYALLDICGEHERALLHAFLDTPGRLLFKALYNDYVEHHKYTGKY